MYILNATKVQATRTELMDSFDKAASIAQPDERAEAAVALKKTVREKFGQLRQSEGLIALGGLGLIVTAALLPAALGTAALLSFVAGAAWCLNSESNTTRLKKEQKVMEDKASEIVLDIFRTDLDAARGSSRLTQSLMDIFESKAEKTEQLFMELKADVARTSAPKP